MIGASFPECLAKVQYLHTDVQYRREKPMRLRVMAAPAASSRASFYFPPPPQHAVATAGALSTTVSSGCLKRAY